MRLPDVLTAELTYKCNHRCLFCSCPWESKAELKDSEMSANEWLSVFEKVKPYGVKHITFSGGEATMRDDLFEILDGAHRLGYSIGCSTNGENADDKFLHEIKKYNCLLSISVPGIDTFAQTTGCDSIENILALFDKCKNLKIQTVANIAVTKKNIKELYENIALPILHGATYVLLNRFLPGGRGLSNIEYLLSLDEINEMFDIAEEVLSKAGIHGHIGTEMPYCGIKSPEKYKYLNIASLCAAVKSFFVVDPSGYIKVCNHSPERLCKWTEVDSLEENDYWKRFIMRDYIPKMCVGCEHLNVKCDGGCREAAHVYYGNINDSDPCL